MVLADQYQVVHMVEGGGMNKSQLINKLSERTGIPRKEAEAAVNTMFDTVTAALVGGDRVEIRGFGSFSTKLYHPYTGRNPRTGEAISVPTKRLPFFKVGKDTKELVDGRNAGKVSAPAPLPPST
jgi:integration host factor subunit beta